MRNHVTLSVLVVCTMIGLSLKNVSARGLLGERYGGLSVSMTRPGDDFLRSIDNSVISYGANLNLPVHEKVDVTLAVSHQEFEGNLAGWGEISIGTTTFLAGANVLLRPDQKYCPFVIGRAGVVDVDDGDSEAIIMLGGGIEMDLTENAAVTPSLVFEHVDDINEFVLELDGNLWFTENFFGLAGIGYGLDEGDVMFGFGVGLSF